MKFRVTMTYEYEVPDGDMLDVYGTEDPVKAAEIDREGLLCDYGVLPLLVDFRHPAVVAITPLEG